MLLKWYTILSKFIKSNRKTSISIKKKTISKNALLSQHVMQSNMDFILSK